MSYAIAVSGEGNQVTLTQAGPQERAVDAGSWLVNVQSDRGIGQARIAWWGETSPHLLYFLLHLSGLEQFVLNWSDQSIHVNVNSADQSVYQSHQASNEAEVMTTPESPYWIEVTIPAEEGAGYYLRAPAIFVATSPSLWNISWVDFYR